MMPDTLLNLSVSSKGNVSLDVSIWGVGALVLLGALFLLAKMLIDRSAGREHWEAVEATIPLGSIGHVRITPNREAIQIAHRAWVELVTRKAALPFDPEHDVIVEVYDSWYALFGEMRRLARECPAHLYRKDEDVRQTVDLLLAVLNEGLRPHLTQWQARFRAWYDEERRIHPNESPQDTQRRFSEHEALVADILRVNRGLLAYADLLRKLVSGKSRN